VTRSVSAARSTSRLALPAAIAIAVIGFVVLSAVAGSPDDKGASTAAAAPTLALRANKLGRLLVDAQGKTLYLFREDTTSQSTCYAACARIWPPAIVDGKARAGTGLVARKLTTSKRRDTPLRQMVYNGHPLYTAEADVKPGDTSGQGFFGTWFVVSATGKQIGKAKPGEGGY
jgi:predicted lipoprotein with Yx(FWY)xxD motif